MFAGLKLLSDDVNSSNSPTAPADGG